MDINDYRTKYTREEFVREIIQGYSGKLKTGFNCPHNWFLSDIDNRECKSEEICKICWRNSLKDIQFKGEDESKQVKCIDNAKGILKHITIGNYYKIENESESNYLITNDEGIKVWYSKIRFEVEKSYIFNIQDFKSKDIAINCETEEEAEKFFDILIMNGIKKSETDIMKQCYYYGEKTCYEINEGKMFYSDISYYEKEGYSIYKFSGTDFSNTYNKESIDNVALNKVVEGYTFREIITIIKEGEKFTDGNTNISMYNNKIKIEDLNGNYEASYTYGEDYRGFKKVEEIKPTKIYQIEYTSNAYSLHNFISEDDNIKIEEIVECQSNLVNDNWEYCRVKNIIEKELTENEIKLYRKCRKLS